MLKRCWTFPLAVLACVPFLPAPGHTQEPRYTIVIHGGAGADPKQMKPEDRRAVEERLAAVLRRGRERLADGTPGLDVVEEAITALEDDPHFNAGRGAALNMDGEAELDASIMDGKTLACGAVAAARTPRNPIQLARRVMETTPHVLLAANGADRFAQLSGVTQAPPEYFVTPAAQNALRQKLRALSPAPAPGGGQPPWSPPGTVGCVVLDRMGNLVAGTSTGGLTGKRPGRVGDSPLIGAGTYADNRSCAVSCTGVGEEFIRNNVAAQVSWRMRLQSVSLQDAVTAVFHESLPDDVGGLIAVDREGRSVMHFNTAGMSRGVADSAGRLEWGIGPER